MTNPRGWWGSCPSSPPPVPRRAGQGQSPVAEANVILGKVHFSGSMPRTRDHRALGPILPVPTSLPPSFTRGLGGRAVRPAPFPTLLGPPRESTNGRHVSHRRTLALARVSALLQGRSSAGWRCLLRLPSSRSLPQSPCVHLDACLLSVLSVRASEGRAP